MGLNATVPMWNIPTARTTLVTAAPCCPDTNVNRMVGESQGPWSPDLTLLHSYRPCRARCRHLLVSMWDLRPRWLQVNMPESNEHEAGQTDQAFNSTGPKSKHPLMPGSHCSGGC